MKKLVSQCTHRKKDTWSAIKYMGKWYTYSYYIRSKFSYMLDIKDLLLSKKKLYENTKEYLRYIFYEIWRKRKQSYYNCYVSFTKRLIFSRNKKDTSMKCEALLNFWLKFHIQKFLLWNLFHWYNLLNIQNTLFISC